MSQENPFESFLNFQKHFSPSQVPGISPEAWSDLYRKNLEALDQVNKVMAAGYQACAEKQAIVLQEAFIDAQETFRRALAGNASDDNTATAIANAGGLFEKMLSNTREIAEIMTQANVEAMNILQRRLGESLPELEGISAHPGDRPAPRDKGKATNA